MLRRVFLFVFLLALVVPLSAGTVAALPPGFVSYRLERVVGDTDETNEVAEPGEAFRLYLTVRNPNTDGTKLTGVQATVSTTEPGVRITDNVVDISDLTDNKDLESYRSAFLHVSSDVACGTVINVDVKLAANEAYRNFTFPIQVGRSLSTSDTPQTVPNSVDPPPTCDSSSFQPVYETLREPIVVSPVGETTISWYQSYNTLSPADGDLRFSVSTDGGSKWTVVSTYRADDGNLRREFDLTPYAGSTVDVRWESLGADCAVPAFSRWWVQDVVVDLNSIRCNSGASACIGIYTMNAPETSDGDSIVERDEIVTMTLQLRNPLPVTLTGLVASIAVDATSATLVGDYSTYPLIKPVLGPGDSDGVTFRFLVSSSAVCHTSIPIVLHLQADQLVCDLPIPVTVGGDSVFLNDDFESYLTWDLEYPWQVIDNQPCIPGQESYVSGTRSLALTQLNVARKGGFAGACDYNTGAQVIANATSYGAYTVPESPNGVELSWQQVLITEPATNYDIAQLLISTDYGRNWEPVWTIPRNETWELRSFDLTAYTGQTIQIRFSFNTIDDQNNSYPGWYIDDVKIAMREPSCVQVGANPLQPIFCNPKEPMQPILDFTGTAGPSYSDMMELQTEGTITDLQVSVRIDHPRIGDLRLTLKHADTGTSVVLMDRPTFYWNDNGTAKGTANRGLTMPCPGLDMVVTFANGDLGAIQTSACDPYIIPALNGTFSAYDPLGWFNGEPIAGTWVLVVEDLESGQTGYVRDWCLKPTLAPADGSTATVKAFPSFGGPFSVGEQFDVYVTVPHNSSGRVPRSASIQLQYPSNTIELLSAGAGDLGAVMIDPVAGSGVASTQRIWTVGDSNATKPYPNIYRLRFGVVSASVTPFSIVLTEDGSSAVLTSQTDGIAIPAAFDYSALENLEVNALTATPTFTPTMTPTQTATPTATSTPVPSPTPYPSCAPGVPYTATPTPDVSPTPAPSVTPAVLEPAILFVDATETAITAHHTTFADLDLRRQFIGFWSRRLNDPNAAWKYYGFIEYSGTASTSLAWNPEPNSLYDIAARYYVEGQGWAAPSVYGRFSNIGPAVYPVIGAMHLDVKSNAAWVAFDTTGTLPCSIGFWSRPMDNSHSIPPHSAEPLTGWTYHGLFPYTLGDTGMAIPFKYTSGVYEIASQVYVKGVGFIGPYMIDYAPYGETGFPKLYGIHFNHSKGEVTVKFSPVGTEKCNIGLWYRELSPYTCEPMCNWNFVGYREYKPYSRNIEFPVFPENPNGIFQFSARLNVFEYESDSYTGWFTPYFITSEACTPLPAGK